MADGPVLALRERIDQEIANAGEGIVNAVVDQLVSAERKRRADILIAAVNTLRQAELDLRKVDRPDQVHYHNDGSTMHEGILAIGHTSVNEGRKNMDQLLLAPVS